MTRLWDFDSIGVTDNCTGCGICAGVDPAGAISPEESNRIDVEKCITCCTFIKNCPRKARFMKPGPVIGAAGRIHTLYSARKEPELFF